MPFPFNARRACSFLTLPLGMRLAETPPQRPLLAINHQFTRSFFKQQIDYVRALGDAVVLEQPARTQQPLGWYSRWLPPDKIQRTRIVSEGR